jgi:hypothetical protein
MQLDAGGAGILAARLFFVKRAGYATFTRTRQAFLAVSAV